MPRACSALPTVSGKTEAERLYWQEKGKIETEIEALKRGAAAERESAAARGEREPAPRRRGHNRLCDRGISGYPEEG